MNKLAPSGLELFLQTFVLPLVAGGEVHVSEPIKPDDLPTWEVELSSHSALLEQIDEARFAAIATLVVRPPPLLFGETELRLCAALYGALVLAHPRSEGWFNRRGRRELEVFSRQLADVPAAETTAQLLSRHATLARMFELIRHDSLVRWWTGKAEFRGVKPPPRLYRWRRVRRVKEELSEVAAGELLAADDGRAILAALLDASPLTDLLSLPSSNRRYPPFRWGSQLGVLRDAELARAVAYRWLDELREDAPDTRGLLPSAIASDRARNLRAPAAAAVAWEHALATPLELLPRARPRTDGDAPALPAPSMPQLAAPGTSTPLPPADIRAATAFLVHLNALCALAEIDQQDLDAPSALIAAGLSAKRGDLGGTDATGTRLFFCVPDVAGRCDPALVAPGGVDSDARLKRRWAAHRAQVTAALGEERLAQLARRLMVCL